MQHLAASSLVERPIEIQRSLTSLTVRKRRHLGTIIGGSVLAILVIMFGIDVATNPAFGWAVVTDYLFSPQILHGVWLTIVLTVISMTAGIVLGIVLAIDARCPTTRSSPRSAGATSGSSAAHHCSCS